MKVSIYTGTRGGAYGGAENTIVAAAEALSQRHNVELLTHDPAMTLDRFAARAVGKLDGVTLRQVAEEPPPSDRFRPQRVLAVRRWHAALSRDTDIFFNIANRGVPFCQAPLGILRVFFPFFIPRFQHTNHGMFRYLRRAYFRSEWMARMGSYQIRLANSAYTAGWVRRRWGVDCEVLHPPVDIDFPAAEKRPQIVSVGRFAMFGNHKKQLEMVRAFCREEVLVTTGWSFDVIGGIGPEPEDRDYFERVQAEGAGFPVRVRADVSREALKTTFAEASIFWHAAGWGEDPEEKPETYEHFGQATVEAMAAGCVPVVIRGGGQPEIVEHGKSGFLWETEEELLSYTRRLVEDSSLRQAMSEAARERAKKFSRASFMTRLKEIVERGAGA